MDYNSDFTTLLEEGSSKNLSGAVTFEDTKDKVGFIFGVEGQYQFTPVLGLPICARVAMYGKMVMTLTTVCWHSPLGTNSRDNHIRVAVLLATINLK